jgi:hypothetical protein
MAYSKRSAHDTCSHGLQSLGITECCCGSISSEGQLLTFPNVQLQAQHCEYQTLILLRVSSWMECKHHVYSAALFSNAMACRLLGPLTPSSSEQAHDHAPKRVTTCLSFC